MPRKEIFYISNLISLSRFILLGIMLLFLINHNYLLTGVMLVIIWLSDLLDGYIARKRNEISELGKIIDPLADKVTIICLVLVLLMQNLLPLWFVVVILMRDVIILLGGLYLKNKKGIVLASSFAGKISVFIIGFTVLIVILLQEQKLNYAPVNLELLMNIMLLVSIGMALLSLIVYSSRFIKTVTK